MQIFFGDVARLACEDRREGFFESQNRALDRHHVVFDAKRLHDPRRVVERLLRRIAIGQHHATHAVRSQGIDRHRCHEGGIDAARKPEHDALEAILVHVVA